ncbi:MAG: hypothetical protein ACLVJ6_17345 [Merdibacter sp.]
MPQDATVTMEDELVRRLSWQKTALYQRNEKQEAVGRCHASGRVR